MNVAAVVLWTLYGLGAQSMVWALYRWAPSLWAVGVPAGLIQPAIRTYMAERYRGTDPLPWNLGKVFPYRGALYTVVVVWGLYSLLWPVTVALDGLLFLLDKVMSLLTKKDIESVRERNILRHRWGWVSQLSALYMVAVGIDWTLCCLFGPLRAHTWMYVLVVLVTGVVVLLPAFVLEGARRMHVIKQNAALVAHVDDEDRAAEALVRAEAERHPADFGSTGEEPEEGPFGKTVDDWPPVARREGPWPPYSQEK